MTGPYPHSGDYRNFFEQNGRRYSHIIDPGTGRPVLQTLVSVTVISDRAAAADATAAALMASGAEKGWQMAREHHLAAFFISSEANGFRNATPMNSPPICGLNHNTPDTQPVSPAMTLALCLLRPAQKPIKRLHRPARLDLDVAEGEFFALLGPNGAGKSTTIGILTRWCKTNGTVTVFGHDLDRELTAAKSCIRAVPPRSNFNQFEPVDEIIINQAGYYGIPRDIARTRAEAYRQLGLWEKRRQIARELSGGMKRRLMIARALVHEPPADP